MKLRAGDSLINDNGDVWTVVTVHRNGAVTILEPPGAGTDEPELTYSAGEIESFFRKLPAGYSDMSWLDPKPYWNSAKAKPKGKKRTQSALDRAMKKRDVPQTSTRGVRL